MKGELGFVHGSRRQASQAQVSDCEASAGAFWHGSGIFAVNVHGVGHSHQIMCAGLAAPFGVCLARLAIAVVVEGMFVF